MLFEITEDDFADLMKSNYYWSLSDEATRCIYKHFKNDTIEDKYYFITAFFNAVEVSVEDIYNDNKDKFKSRYDAIRYLENNDKITFNEATYKNYGWFRYNDGSIGYLLNFV